MADEYELKQVTVRLCLKEAEPLYSNEAITDSDKAIKVMADALREMDREYVCVVNLDTRRVPLNYSVVSIGDTMNCAVPIQNLFKVAILQNSSSLICLHNHPSGSKVPSKPDLDVTKRMVEAGNIIGIPVIDHIIVAGGTGDHESIRRTNPELFSRAVEENHKVSVKEKIAEKKILSASINKDKNFENNNRITQTR